MRYYFFYKYVYKMKFVLFIRNLFFNVILISLFNLVLLLKMLLLFFKSLFMFMRFFLILRNDFGMIFIDFKFFIFCLMIMV